MLRCVAAAAPQQPRACARQAPYCRAPEKGRPPFCRWVQKGGRRKDATPRYRGGAW